MECAYGFDVRLLILVSQPAGLCDSAVRPGNPLDHAAASIFLEGSNHRLVTFSNRIYV